MTSSDRNQPTIKAPKRTVKNHARRSLLVFEQGGTRVVDLPEEGRLVVGRAPEVDIVLSDPSVSRRQLELVIDREGVVACDLGGRNAALLGDEPLVGSAPLPPGVALRMGATMLLVADSAARKGKGPLAHIEFEARLSDCLETGRAQGVTVAVFMVRTPGAAELVASALRRVLGAGSVIGAYGGDHFEAFAVIGPGVEPTGLAQSLELGLSAAGLVAAVGYALYPRDGTSHGELIAACISALKPQPVAVTAGPVIAEPAMQKVFDLARRVAAGRIPVLLVGETGSGKEVLAEHIHKSSPRARAPFLRINCAALPESLLESELFGYEKGTFTGALKPKAGLFEAADGGTLMLDEVGELPLAQQAKLLRALEDGTVRRLGSLKDRRVDVRLIAATNRDLEDAGARGTFRKDLYFRLSGVIVTIPPLRERPRDVLALVSQFVAEMGGGRVTLGRAAEEVIGRYGWPGNIRELRNAIERAVLLCGSGRIEPEHLPERVRLLPTSPRVIDPEQPAHGYAAVRDEMREIERSRILEALDACAGNQTRAAERLGISRRTLVAKLSAYGITRRRSPR